MPPASRAAPSMQIFRAALIRLFKAIGTKLLARRRVQGRTEELEVLRDSMTSWKADWTIVEKALAAVQLQDRLRNEDGRVVARSEIVPQGEEAAGPVRSFSRGAMQVLRQNGEPGSLCAAIARRPHRSTRSTARGNRQRPRGHAVPPPGVAPARRRA